MLLVSGPRHLNDNLIDCCHAEHGSLPDAGKALHVCVIQVSANIYGSMNTLLLFLWHLPAQTANLDLAYQPGCCKSAQESP